MKKLFFLIALLAVSTVTFAEVVEIDGVYYELSPRDKTAEVVSNPNYYSGNVDIPRGVPYEDEEYQVISIGKDAFRDCRLLTSVYISEGIKEISPYAFCHCESLSEVELPNSIYYIGIYSFAQAKNLKSVKFGNGIKTIGAYAFMDCVSLKTISFPNSVEHIVGGALSGCTSLESVSLPDHLKEISDYLFTGCQSLTSVRIAESVNEIGKNAFYYCKSLSHLEVPGSLGIISPYAFAECSALKDFYCYAQQVPDTDISAFNNTPIENATLYVPEKSVDQYKATSPWSTFKNIAPITDTGMSVGIVEKDIDAVYDLGGKKASVDQKGIKIIKFTDGTTQKVNR